MDLGDYVFVEGRVISSKRGELSVLASRWELAFKALRPGAMSTSFVSNAEATIQRRT